MPFKPQTKRFALVPVEPGNEKDTDVIVSQDADGDIQIDTVTNDFDCGWVLLKDDPAFIAALGFPTEGEKSVSELSAIPKELK